MGSFAGRMGEKYGVILTKIKTKCEKVCTITGKKIYETAYSLALLDKLWYLS